MICPYLNEECKYDFMADICQNCIHIILNENENKETNSRTDKK